MVDPGEKEAALQKNKKAKSGEPAWTDKRLRAGVGKGVGLHKKLEERLKFERLLADISARLISVSGERLDQEIKLSQQHLCESLDIDFSGFWQVSGKGNDSLKLVHYYRSPELAPDIPSPWESLESREFFPWALEKLLKGETVKVARVADHPGLTAHDRETMQHFGAKSVITFPLSVGGGNVFGALGFTFIRREMDWPEEIVGRLRLLADIFAAAIARQMAEDALRESEERVRLAVDSAESGLWSIDFKTGRIWATAKTRQLYGFSVDEEITRDKYQKAIHPDDRDMVNRTVNRPFEGDTGFLTEYRVVLPDGNMRWIKAQAKGYYSPSGVLEHLTGVSSDISQRKQSETDMSQLRNELAHLERVTMMNEISSALAHEINQPLGSILNNASAAHLILARGNNRPEEINEILEDIIEDARRAGDVVRKIRGIVKESEVHWERLDINNIIVNIAKLVRNRIIMSRISLCLELQPDIENVKGDHVHLQQVLVNLINNSVDAMSAGPPRALTIRSKMTAPDTVLISVIDTGTGFDSSLEGKLFKPFITTKQDGMGMGLRICRSIIEEHGGRILAENNTGGGATVSFSLKTWREEPG